ncbi:MAG: dihydrodipicolinate reductase [Deltaproteobacteria bacterium]|nr:dihydrodipicolinate reductase [Deltaproteobacteria bacterium]
MTKEIRIIQYGVGPIGAGIVRLLLEKPGMRLVGAVDIDPAKVGQDLGRAVGVGRDLGAKISDQAVQALKTKADIVVHSTSSYLADVEEQLFQCIDAGLSVISTCEELVYPFRKHPRLSEKLDAEAQKKGVAVLATGINPGFLMDKLVLTLAATCQRVDAVEVTRIVDAGQRRLPLQKKIGAALSPEEFGTMAAAGKIKHHGLPESTAMIADSLGLRLDEIRETIEPVISPSRICTEFLEVQPGQVAGVSQVAHGASAGRELIRLELQMYVGAEQPMDEVTIHGLPELRCQIPGGVHGDLATAAIVVNCIPALLQASPGLRSPLDIAMCYFPGQLNGKEVSSSGLRVSNDNAERETPSPKLDAKGVAYAQEQ